jgi:hypothetical protein
METHQWWEHRCWGWEHLRRTPKKPKKLPVFHHSGDGQDAYFKDFTKAWIKLQENGVPELRDAL